MPPTFRPGTTDDSYAVYQVFVRSLADLDRRMNLQLGAWEDPGFVESLWARRRPLYEHLAGVADEFWVAEQDGEVIGFARSIYQDGHQELTEFFVLPGHQSGGVGGGLLARAFPDRGARRRSIVATLDSRAQASYLKLGVYPRFTIQYLYGKPEPVTLESDLHFERASADVSTLAVIRAIDLELLGFRRDATHAHLLQDRQGYLYLRGNQVVGYGYLGNGTGPMALLEESDVPAALAHAERRAAERGEDHFGVELPMVNRAAVQHLLGRGFRLEPFVAVLMSDEPFGRFENYVLSSPPFFL
jgi:GNAT superfamily N-acetyltransferase